MSDTIFEVIHHRLLEWPSLYPEGELDLVAELVQIQGQIVVSASIGSSHADQELPYHDHATGKTDQRRVGNFINALTGQGILRDGQALNIFFPELLKFCLTPSDRAYHQNVQTLITFLRKIKEEKLAEIKSGKVGIDLFSIMLDEGGDVYSLIKDEQLADQTMFDDICFIYLAAVSTTQVTVNNLMKYVHMDEYKPVREKLQTEVDTFLAFKAWDAQGNEANH